MARPKSDGPRSVTVKVRVTVGEKAVLDAAASAAGVAVSELCRVRALGQALVGEVRSGGAGTPSSALVPSSPPAAPAEASGRSPLARARGRSVVREDAPMTELPKIARRHWADD